MPDRPVFDRQRELPQVPDVEVRVLQLDARARVARKDRPPTGGIEFDGGLVASDVLTQTMSGDSFGTWIWHCGDASGLIRYWRPLPQ